MFLAVLPALLLSIIAGCSSGTSAGTPAGMDAAPATDQAQAAMAPSLGTPAPAPGAAAAPPPSALSTSSACDESLWNHVYNPQRLHRIQDCQTVTGTIAAVRKEDDGDYHIRLALDPQFSGMLNQKNVDQQHGDLVLEPVCQNKVTQEDAQDACAGFSYAVTVPKAGQHVTVVGDYVLDAEHGWNELHPVYSITPG